MAESSTAEARGVVGVGFGGWEPPGVTCHRRQLRFPRLQVVEDVACFVNFVAIKLDLAPKKISFQWQFQALLGF